MLLRNVLLTVSCAALGTCLALPVHAQDWGGTTKTVDGVEFVQNPSQAIIPSDTIALDELWRLGGDSEEDHEFFGVISDFLIDAENNIYILDAQLCELRMFNERGEYIRSMGREGEGPGEFRRPNSLLFMPDGKIGVVQPFPSKLVLFEPDGTPAGDFPFSPEGKGFFGLVGGALSGDNLAMVYNNMQPNEGEFVRKVVLANVNSEGEVQTVMTEGTSSMSYADSHCIETEWNLFERCWSAGGDGSVYARNEFTAYEISVWDDQGALKRVITREYPKHAREKEDIERIEERWANSIARWVQSPSFDIEENWNPIEDLYGRTDGSLWVRTSRGARDLDDGIMASFDIFDADGRYLQEVIFEGEFDPENDGLFITDQYAFVVTDLISARNAFGAGGGAEEDEEEMEEDIEPMTIICYRLNIGPVASR